MDRRKFFKTAAAGMGLVAFGMYEYGKTEPQKKETREIQEGEVIQTEAGEIIVSGMVASFRARPSEGVQKRLEQARAQGQKAFIGVWSGLERSTIGDTKYYLQDGATVEQDGKFSRTSHEFSGKEFADDKDAYFGCLPDGQGNCTIRIDFRNDDTEKTEHLQEFTYRPKDLKRYRLKWGPEIVSQVDLDRYPKQKKLLMQRLDAFFSIRITFEDRTKIVNADGLRVFILPHTIADSHSEQAFFAPMRRGDQLVDTKTPVAIRINSQSLTNPTYENEFDIFSHHEIIHASAPKSLYIGEDKTWECLKQYNFFELFDESTYLKPLVKSAKVEDRIGHPNENQQEFFASALTVIQYFWPSFKQKIESVINNNLKQNAGPDEYVRIRTLREALGTVISQVESSYILSDVRTKELNLLREELREAEKKLNEPSSKE